MGVHTAPPRTIIRVYPYTDDIPDKLRRNLVVLSSAILAIFFLNLSFKPSATLLGIADVGNLAAWKVWLCLAVVLAYVFLRYRFAAQTAGELAEMGKTFTEWRRQAAYDCLKRSMRAYLLRGRPVTWLDNFDHFVDEDIKRRMERDGPASEVDELIPSVNWSDKAWHVGNVGFQFHAIWASSSYGRSGGMRHDFRLPRHLRTRIVASCALRAVTYSRSAVDVVVPFALATLAAGVCLIRLAGFVRGAATGTPARPGTPGAARRAPGGHRPAG